MKAVVFDIRGNSLFSIRIPYTWQSALAYCLPPPSSIIGMLANVLQRAKNDKHPLYYLDKVEEQVIWAGSKLLTPAVIKSYTTSAITKWEVPIGGKSTNALGRQFVFCKNIEIVVVINDDAFACELIKVLKTTPITCGDSESIATVENIQPLYDIEPKNLEYGMEIESEFPIPFKLEVIEILQGSGRLYLIHERCKKTDKNFPLINYLYPIKEKDNILYPEKFTLKIKQPVCGLEIEQIGMVIKR